MRLANSIAIAMVTASLHLLLRLKWAMTQRIWAIRLARLGSGTRIYPTAVIHNAKDVILGDNVVINDFVHIWGGGGVEIGSDSMVAAHTVIASQSHDVAALESGTLYRLTSTRAKVTIGRNVWIGSGVTVLPGVSIGDGCVIGAGAVVTGDVPPRTLAIGVPARIARTL